jgi:uncharacterized protein YjbJ (UPF0337 family)
MARVGDKIVGKAEELKGKVTGDRSEEAKGKARQAKGEAKGTAARAKHKVEDKLDKHEVRNVRSLADAQPALERGDRPGEIALTEVKAAHSPVRGDHAERVIHGISDVHGLFGKGRPLGERPEGGEAAT